MWLLHWSFINNNSRDPSPTDLYCGTGLDVTRYVFLIEENIYEVTDGLDATLAVPLGSVGSSVV